MARPSGQSLASALATAATASSLPCGRAQAGAGSRASRTAVPPASSTPPAPGAGAPESPKARANSDAVVAPASGSRASLASAHGRAGARPAAFQPGVAAPPLPLRRSTAAAAAAANPPGVPNAVPTTPVPALAPGAVAPGRREHVLHRALDGLVDRARIAEAHLDLGRVHVDVDARRVDLDEQHVGRLLLAVQHVLVGGAQRVRDQAVAHVAAVDVDVLVVAARARRGGQADAAADGDGADLGLQRAAVVDEVVAQHVADALRLSSAARATAPPACLRATPRSPRPAAPARGGARPRCNGPARWSRTSGTCGAPAC